MFLPRGRIATWILKKHTVTRIGRSQDVPDARERCRSCGSASRPIHPFSSEPTIAAAKPANRKRNMCVLVKILRPTAREMKIEREKRRREKTRRPPAPFLSTHGLPSPYSSFSSRFPPSFFGYTVCLSSCLPHVPHEAWYPEAISI